LIVRTELFSGETCVTVCIAVRGIERGRMMYRQREECDRQREETSKLMQLIERTELVSGEMCVTVCIAARGIQRGRMM
jgi:hypothetical protein